MLSLLKRTPPSTQTSAAIRRDLRTVAAFIQIYCDARHADRDRSPATVLRQPARHIVGRDVTLCRACEKLLAHATVKRQHCPFDPKPLCKACPAHCYAPRYRRQIRAVMRYAGMRLLLSGRVDYLWHLLR
jgi:hypothetical protein